MKTNECQECMGAGWVGDVDMSGHLVQLRCDKCKGTGTYARPCKYISQDNRHITKIPAPTRRRKLIPLLRTGEYTARDLAERFGVAVCTIFQDRSTLKKAGLL